jgi:hypothetical protein
MDKLMLKKQNFLRSRKNNEVTFFRKECNDLLVIRYLILSVTVPLQLLVIYYTIVVVVVVQFGPSPRSSVLAPARATPTSSLQLAGIKTG